LLLAETFAFVCVRSKVSAPLVTCVALNRTDGEFEKNLASLNLTQSKDFYYFS